MMDLVSIVDFDGTITDVHKEAEPFVLGWKQDLAKMLRMGNGDFDNLWDATERKILADPGKYGWMVNGIIMAPATTDNYVLSTTISQEILAEREWAKDDIEQATAALFKNNYPKTETMFRQHAADFLEFLNDIGKVYIVTNSGTENVQKKLDKLHLGKISKDIRLIGGAKKFVPFPDWDGVPPFISKKGFERPVYLRRKSYYDILEGIIQPKYEDSTVAIGDSYELDLLVPEFMGMSTILLKKKGMYEGEIEAALDYEKGFLAEDLMTAKKYISIRW